MTHLRSDPAPHTASKGRASRWLASLVILGIAAILAADGLARLAALRTGAFAGRGRTLATSPIPYRTALPSFRAQFPAQPEAFAVIRVDSLGSADAPCTARAEIAKQGPAIFIALSDDVRECEGVPTIRPEAGSRAELRKELAGARWVVLGSDAVALYSRRALPDADVVRRTVALFSSAQKEGE